jgi:hypothetical protein
MALAAGFSPVAVRLAVAAATHALVAGANCTVTVHDFSGPRLVAVQLSAVMVNAAEPDNATVSTALADPPELASVNVCDAVWPSVTCP